MSLCDVTHCLLDVMMRFSPSFAAVSFMEIGFSPTEACERALKPIANAFPAFSGGIVCLSKNGTVGGAAYNMDFSYSVMKDGMADVDVIIVKNDGK